MATTAPSSLAFGSGSPGRPAQYWKVALLGLAVVVFALDLWALSTGQRSLDPQPRGTLAARFDPSVQAGGWQTITTLDPQSPLRSAGAMVGDSVRFRHRGEAWLRRFGTDERIDLELRTVGGVRPLSLRPIKASEFVASRVIPAYSATWLARLFALAIGALLAMRRPDSPAIRGLALSLILGPLAGYALPSGELREQGVVWLWPLVEDLGVLGSLWFALQVQRSGSVLKRIPVTLSILSALLALLLVPLFRWSLQWRLGYDASIWHALPGLLWLSGAQGYAMLFAVIDMATVATLLLAWHQSTGATRVRIAWIAAALAGPMLWEVVFSFVWQWLSSTYDVPATWISAVSSYVDLGGSLLLGWAVLRQRVFDFKIVVQRALAYSIVSVAILVLLGAGKWAAENLLENMSGERGFVHDGVIVVVVVAVFAALQHRILKVVTRLFFSAWHRASEAFRESVDRAAQAVDPALVKHDFVAAVDLFTEGQGCALYWADAAGTLHLDRATLEGAAREIAGGDELAQKLRQSPRRVDLAPFRERVPGDWAFPMPVRGSLYGALLIGPRTEGISYRPEELVQLAESARTMGLHLEGLRIVELQREHSALTQRLNELQAAGVVTASSAGDLAGAAGQVA